MSDDLLEQSDSVQTEESVMDNSQTETQDRAERRIKNLVSKLKSKDEVLNDLQNKVDQAVSSIKPYQERLDRLEFENQIARTSPGLVNKAGDLYEIKKQHPTLTNEQVIALNLGQSFIQNPPQGSQSDTISGVNIAISPSQGKSFADLDDNELQQVAEQEWRSRAGN